MKIHPFLIEMVQIAVLLFAAPLFAGWVKMVKCWSQGRTAPSLFQPVRDIRKLLSKDVVLAENASWIFRFTPYLVFGVTVLAGGIIVLIVRGPAALKDILRLVSDSLFRRCRACGYRYFSWARRCPRCGEE